MKVRVPLFLAVVLFYLSAIANAALWDRGGGLIYDDVLNITWLQDANYSQTSGYDNDGRMNAQQAVNWVGSLAYYDSVRQVTLTGWRLPSPLNLDGTGPTLGYNVNTEMGHLWYFDLGNRQDDFWQTLNTGPFLNVETGNSFYWLQGTYTFHFGQPNCYLTGPQYNEDLLSVWAVRDGDVTPVPLPSAALLFGSGLVMVWGRIARDRRRRIKSNLEHTPPPI